MSASNPSESPRAGTMSSVPVSSHLSWPTEPWLTCPYGHAAQSYQVCISRPEGAAVIEDVVVPDASNWLCEIRCLRSNCSRRWMACSVCRHRFPGKGTLSGKKRPRDRVLRNETTEAVARHQSDRTHQTSLHALMLSLPSEELPTNASLSQHESLPGDVCNTFDDEMAPPIPTTIVTATDQSEQFTSLILKSAVASNSNVGNFIQKEDTQRLMGPRHIVSMACEESRRHGDAWRVSYMNPAPVFGTKFMFAYTQIFEELSIKSRRKFVSVMDVAFDTPPSERLGPNFGRASVPASLNDANRICLRGVHSIVNSLPLPRMVILGAQKEQHVCVYPLDLIQYIFTTLPANILASLPVIVKDETAKIPPESVKTYFESQDYYNEVKDTLESLCTSNFGATIQIMVRWFCDAWDPDSTKDNRNGVWSMLMTIMLGPESGGKEIVFPVAIGPKSGDHSPALEWVLDRMKELGDYVVVRDVPNQRNVRLRVSTALIQVDRLERGDLWGGLNHASNRGKCHGIVAGYGNLQHKSFAPCSTCEMAIIVIAISRSTDLVELPHCHVCACYDASSPLLTGKVPSDIKKVIIPIPSPSETEENQEHLSDAASTTDGIPFKQPWLPPTGRPVPSRDEGLPQSPPDVPEVYGPIVADQNFLILACRFLSYHAWRGHIKTKDYTKAWSKACGISYQGIMLPIFKESVRHRQLGTVQFEEVFTKELLPPTWLNASWRMEKFLHAPMHLLFLGVTSKVVEMLDEWLAFHTIKAPFNASSSKGCDLVGKLRLDWLKLLRYGASTLSRGSWVSEQYVAFSKFMLVPVCGLILATAPGPEELKVVLRVIDSCVFAISLLMCRVVDAYIIQRSQVAIKAYLIAIDEFGHLLHCRKRTKKGKSLSEPASKSKYDPISINNPNNASLLRAIMSMVTHGPPCDQWDGKIGNEASIQEIKLFFHGTCMVDGGSVESSLKRYYRHRFLIEIGEYLDKDDSCSLFQTDDEDVEGTARYSGALRYSTLEDVAAIINGTDVTKGAVSAVLYEDTSGRQVLAVAVGKRTQEPKLYELRLSQVQSIYTLFQSALPEETYVFVSDFMSFGRLSLSDQSFSPSEGGYAMSSKVCLVSARHVWMDEKHCRPVPEKDRFQSMFAVVADDYRKLAPDGKIIEIRALSRSLWEGVAAGTERAGHDWDTILQSGPTDVSSLTVAELKGHLRRHGQPLGGLKPALLARVQELMVTVPNLLSEVDQATTSRDTTVD